MIKQLGESGENYLEVILDIEREMGEVRSVEIARRVGVSRASVSKALGVLRDAGLVEPSYYSDVVLTDEGHARAQEIRNRHDLLVRFLEKGLGVEHDVAERDACRMEHVVSKELLTHIDRWLAPRVGSFFAPEDIRLIAADMDGTLLDGAQNLSPRLVPALKALGERGVRFAAASGRQYYNLVERFPELWETMYFISENGAMVAEGGKVLYVSEIPYDMLEAPVQAVRALPGAYVILCGEKGAYLEHDDPVFRENAAMYYARLSRVDDVLEAAKGDRICKIAVFQHRTVEQGAYPAMQGFDGAFQTALSGDSWVDLMMPGTNKGGALHKLQEAMGIGPDACMAFGDYLNDYELLQAVTHSYAMANAHPDLKSACRYIAPSNEEDGVVQVLMERFDLPG